MTRDLTKLLDYQAAAHALDCSEPGAELCVKHPTQSGLGEWYETYWPNLAGYVESMGAMLAPLGIEMRRGQLVNPKW